MSAEKECASSLSRYSGRGQGEGDLADPVRRRCEDLVFEITLTPALSRSTGRGRMGLARHRLVRCRLAGRHATSNEVAPTARLSPSFGSSNVFAESIAAEKK